MDASPPYTHIIILLHMIITTLIHLFRYAVFELIYLYFWMHTQLISPVLMLCAFKATLCRNSIQHRHLENVYVEVNVYVTLGSDHRLLRSH